ncbi:MAG: hypothetical protein QM528_09280 [Phycisphaerales bacterium]|nr:hypothetical protein [Phycisphaerales bacterium]
MKKNFFLFAVLAFLGTFFACKKNTETNPTPQLSTNYWCYMLEGVTSPRYAIASPVIFDTMTEMDGAVMDTNTYFVFASTNTPPVAGQMVQVVAISINRFVNSTTLLFRLIDSLTMASTMNPKMASISLGKNEELQDPVNFEISYLVGTWNGTTESIDVTAGGNFGSPSATGTFTLDSLSSTTFGFNATANSGDTAVNLTYGGTVFVAPINMMNMGVRLGSKSHAKSRI